MWPCRGRRDGGTDRQWSAVCRWFLAGFVIMSAARPSRCDLEAVVTQLRDELCRRRREVKQLRVENEILREAAALPAVIPRARRAGLCLPVAPATILCWRQDLIKHC
jgi:hypothetical protein